MSSQDRNDMRKGECLITSTGIEGGLIYGWSSSLRDTLLDKGSAGVVIDLLPDRDAETVRQQVSWPRGSRSWSRHLGSRLGLKGAKLGLLRECLPPERFNDAKVLAATIKRLPLTLVGMQPLEEAISSAGGVSFTALDQDLMLKVMPGVFCAGEMLDWEAPTGGYLLTACFASGRVAGKAVKQWLERRPSN